MMEILLGLHQGEGDPCLGQLGGEVQARVAATWDWENVSFMIYFIPLPMMTTLTPSTCWADSLLEPEPILLVIF